MIGILSPRARQSSALSRLLSGLTFQREPHAAVIRSMLLQCYAGMDAFRRGAGSRELFWAIARQLMVAEALCHLDHLPEEIVVIERAHQVMFEVDAAERASGDWLFNLEQFNELSVAFDAYARQLTSASPQLVARAQHRMISALQDVARHSQAAGTSVSSTVRSRTRVYPGKHGPHRDA